MNTLLEINNLSVEFPSADSTARVVDGISFHLDKGETLGIVGESGSGKSVTALSIMRLLPGAGKITSGEILFQTTNNLLALPEPSLPAVRGAEIAMIFQEPMTSLNPVFRCGEQVAEAIRLHQKVSFENAKAQTIKLFERVRLADPERIFDAFPHQISGGQKQRVMIAMAMSCQPKILIADEPTTALDVTVQKTILDLMGELKTETGLSMLFISHDLGVISEICDRVVVMFQGKIVEEGRVEKILEQPEHPYTKGLVACRPSLRRKWRRMPTVSDFLEQKNYAAQVVAPAETAKRRESIFSQKPVLQVNNLTVRYPTKKNWLGQPAEWLHAVDDVSFEVFPGETFGLAGESGCGKTTLGRAIARLTEPFSGKIFYRNTDLLQLSEEEFHPFRREIQVVFQDPYSSLNPRIPIGEAITEPMKVHGLHANEQIRREKAIELLEVTGLKGDHFYRFPHEFSGGQRQRICLARALAVEPKLLICDEIVSSLDVSVQATVLNLLMDLQEKYGLTYLFISHDLSVIQQMCDRLLVMNRGKIEALGFPENIFQQTENEYVRNLVESIPGQ